MAARPELLGTQRMLRVLYKYGQAVQVPPGSFPSGWVDLKKRSPRPLHAQGSTVSDQSAAQKREELPLLALRAGGGSVFNIWAGSKQGADVGVQRTLVARDPHHELNGRNDPAAPFRPAGRIRQAGTHR